MIEEKHYEAIAAVLNNPQVELILSAWVDGRVDRAHGLGFLVSRLAPLLVAARQEGIDSVNAAKTESAAP